MKLQEHEPTVTAEQLALAQQLFIEYRTSCFWHIPVDYRISSEDIPYLRSELRAHGGRRGFLASRRLCR